MDCNEAVRWRIVSTSKVFLHHDIPINFFLKAWSSGTRT